MCQYVPDKIREPLTDRVGTVYCTHKRHYNQYVKNKTYACAAAGVDQKI